MRRFKSLFVAVFAAVLLICVTAGPAFANSDSATWTDITSPGSYCGYSFGLVNSSGGLVYGQGEIVVHAGNPCSNSGAIVPLPANYLTLKVSIRCLLSNGTQFEGYSSGTFANAAGTGRIAILTPLGSFCGSQVGAYPKTRVVITAQYFVFPAGWQTYLHTTHWSNP